MKKIKKTAAIILAASLRARQSQGWSFSGEDAESDGN